MTKHTVQPALIGWGKKMTKGNELFLSSEGWDHGQPSWVHAVTDEKRRQRSELGCPDHADVWGSGAVQAPGRVQLIPTRNWKF